MNEQPDAPQSETAEPVVISGGAGAVIQPNQQPTVVMPDSTLIPDIDTGGNSKNSSPPNDFFHPVVAGKPYPVIANTETSSEPDEKPEPKKRRLKYIGFGLAGVLALCIVVALTNSNIRTAIFGGKFSNYTLVSKNGKYSVRFYRKAKIEYRDFDSSHTDIIITSPEMKQFGRSVVMILGTTRDVSDESLAQRVTKDDNCDVMYKSREDLSISITGLKSTAKFCGFRDVLYYSYFGADRTLYFTQIQIQIPDQYKSLLALQKDDSGSSFLKNQLDTNDVKTIVESIKPLR